MCFRSTFDLHCSGWICSCVLQTSYVSCHYTFSCIITLTFLRLCRVVFIISLKFYCAETLFAPLHEVWADSYPFLIHFFCFLHIWDQILQVFWVYKWQWLKWELYLWKACRLSLEGKASSLCDGLYCVVVNILRWLFMERRNWVTALFYLLFSTALPCHTF